MKKCAYCSRELPEPGHSHYMLAVGSLGYETAVCVGCIKRLKLKPTRLVKVGTS